MTTRAALEAIGLLPDTEIDIGDAALQLARIDAPDADWQAARAHLSELARDAVALADTIGTRRPADARRGARRAARRPLRLSPAMPRPTTTSPTPT